MGSRNLLTTGVDMSRDPSSELATEPSSTARPATKDAHSQSQTHHPTNRLPPLPLYHDYISQNAACRYTATMWLRAGRPPVLQGRWESRIVSDADGTETREQHHTHKSITLNFPNPNHPTTLQSLIDHWHNGGTYLQACTHPSRVLLLRLSRFQGSEDHGTIKVHLAELEPSNL